MKYRPFVKVVMTVFVGAAFGLSSTVSRAEGVIPRPTPRPSGKPAIKPKPKPAPAPKAPETPGMPAVKAPTSPSGTTGNVTPLVKDVEKQAPKAELPSAFKPAAEKVGSHEGKGGRPSASEKSFDQYVKEGRISKEMAEQLKSSPEAQEGVAVRENLLDAALKTSRSLNPKTASQFEKALAERLVGKDGLKKMKESDIKDMEALTCPNKCGGHEKMALSCRRISRFLSSAEKAGLLASAALGGLFAHFVNSTIEPDQKGSVFLEADGEKLEVTGLNTPIEEEVTKAPEETK